MFQLSSGDIKKERMFLTGGQGVAGSNPVIPTIMSSRVTPGSHGDTGSRFACRHLDMMGPGEIFPAPGKFRIRGIKYI